MLELSSYDRRAIGEVDRFKNPPQDWLGSALDRIIKPVTWAADAALDNRIGETITKGMQGLVGLMNEGASWSVRADAIYEEFRTGGHTTVWLAHDIHRLSLEDVEKVVGRLGAKYKALAFGEGALAGAGGALGIALDIPALVGMSLRSVNEYATYYGFDVSLEAERAFVLTLLLAASSPSVAGKQVAMAELTKLSVLIAKRKTWAELQRFMSVQLVRQVAQALGVRLTKAKLAQIVPVLGAGVGGAFNAWYLAAVTQTACHFYRERFLAEKYGPEVLVQVLGPG